MSSFSHHGPWDERSRQNPALNFIEKYQNIVDSLAFNFVSSTDFFAPFAIYHDTKGSVHVTGAHIWNWLSQQFSPFSHVRHETVTARVVIDEDGRDIVYGEMLTHFRLRGDDEEIVTPRFLVWTLGEAGKGQGMDGRQIYDCKVFWDTGVIGRYITERKKAERVKLEKIEAKRLRR
ncbi:hypothetical protein G7Y89_g4453 [Cudoniella acicularis]|uniref:SnoaL-like domain-containing protein n=1 Tax=Cudoniella acicularis TaxID=354080 RepID=A0A8H4RQV5_9HELO|nr:hypothetical protein G7Y89_g4453 [Cudoniella acicularis]